MHKRDASHTLFYGSSQQLSEKRQDDAPDAVEEPPGSLQFSRHTVFPERFPAGAVIVDGVVDVLLQRLPQLGIQFFGADRRHHFCIQIGRSAVQVVRPDDAEVVIDEDRLRVHGVRVEQFVEFTAALEKEPPVVQKIHAAPGVRPGLRRVGQDGYAAFPVEGEECQVPEHCRAANDVGRLDEDVLPRLHLMVELRKHEGFFVDRSPFPGDQADRLRFGGGRVPVCFLVGVHRRIVPVQRAERVGRPLHLSAVPRVAVFFARRQHPDGVPVVLQSLERCTVRTSQPLRLIDEDVPVQTVFLIREVPQEL